MGVWVCVCVLVDALSLPITLHTFTCFLPEKEIDYNMHTYGFPCIYSVMDFQNLWSMETDEFHQFLENFLASIYFSVSRILSSVLFC